ncbi:hypothetical protein C7M84_016020 [Penaeus vannamei]|uniref:C-type lectin domain-containing protein n=1 Tax=Penaeus vannamei TaxID=6689 RepID=A0A423SP34_PENVA|nr:hypothetical protein C7M84_016020 [Penaeus vannamei]
MPGCTSPFKSYGTKGCLQVVLGKRPLTWHSARSECQAKGGDLAVLDEAEKFRALSAGIDEEHPDMTKGGFTFWVGAERVESSCAGRTASLWSRMRSCGWPGSLLPAAVPVPPSWYLLEALRDVATSPTSAQIPLLLLSSARSSKFEGSSGCECGVG